MSYDVNVGRWFTNYTYNVGRMFYAAIDEGPNDWNGLRANEVAERCQRILAAFHAEPAKYQAMNPPNKWGSFEGARLWIEQIRDRCLRYPTAKVRVS